jgi:hypothetical protein
MERFVMTLPRMANLVGDGAAACADVAKRSKNPEVRAAATYAPVAQTFGLGSKATDAEKKAGRAVLDALVKDLPETRWGRRAAGVLNEMDHLQVGMVAPEIEGKDVDGKPIHLSDFRGKAVLIDFWGFW